MRSSDFYDLVSGRRRGVGATALRGLLAVAEGPYRVGVWWRNRRYDTTPTLVQRVEVPVVSVGNVTLGGSGKTPMVKWVARRLRAEGVRVALVSRGYGSNDGGPNDEALELEQSLPDVPHVQDPDRVAAARIAIDELAAQTIVMDDGFQHRRLARDLDIVLLDATEPFGYGRVFPRGVLREPVKSLRRADVVCLTRSDLVTDSQREAVRLRVAALAPGALWCESVTRPTRLVGVAESATDDSLEAPVETLRGARVAAFCGIGNPAAFRATLLALGAEVVAFVEFADHHAYIRPDVERIEREATAAAADLVVCTHKDLVKVGVATLGALPLWAVAIDAVVTHGGEELASRLAAVAAAAPSDADEDEDEENSNDPTETPSS
ncbi:Tetraacyldisaccharide 4'-kinase [Botrimarina colliarenosi]|uniref:Tetraacyldisaccharide 4'-kinase n=1 Tax=Botrimarina colliarenosi TaxID=2528001 RepID=A0A5C6AI44_9BACT|nr:tetraacyldisaccharide 4'-kinase [Botrimarina colliarenosi]TWT99080.1 Tetraacyldisaccharide 4'-kinase [Botrimarina colliarenosi]